MRRTIGQILADGAEAHPDRNLFSFYDGAGRLADSYSYGRFLRRSNHVAGRLRDSGVAAGQLVLLVYPPGLEMAVAFFACARIGAIPAPAPPPATRGQANWARLAHIAAGSGASHVLCTAELAARLADGTPAALAGLGWIATDRFAGAADACPEQASDVLFVQYTSGSTSAPRGVAVTHANVIHNAGLCIGHDAPVGVSWLPHFHDMGLLGYFLFSLVKGGESHCFAPLDFLRRPALWLRLVSEKRATIVTAPNTAYEYCLRDDKVGDEQLAGVDLGSLVTAVNCAEPVRASTFQRFRRRFARYGLRDRVHVAGYGLAEHTLCVTSGGARLVTPGEEGGAAAAPLVGCGRPAADVDLRIVDPATRRELAAGSVGEIWVDSPSKAAGYWREPELTRRHFQARIADDRTERGYLRTGDLGFLDGGELFVCGRLRDMLVINGRNVFPNDIEALLEERLPKLAGRVVAFGLPDKEIGLERLAVLVEAEAGQPDLAELRQLVQTGCDVAVALAARVPRGSVLHTSSGKIARQLCRENWLAERIAPLELAVFDAPAETGVDALIADLVAQAAALGDPDATLDRLGLDSIALVNLSLALEDLLEAHGLDGPDMKERVADLSLLQALRVSDLAAAMTAFRGAAADGATVRLMLDAAAAAVRRDEQARMRADAAAALPAASFSPTAGHGALVTGATGFLGAYLLRSLLELTDEPVSVLVRADDPGHGADRIRRALVDADMAPEAVDEALDRRLTVLPGDLARPRLGLADADWAALAGAVGRIYHSGAEVDYVKSYNLLRPANVAATREVIALAAEGCRKTLHHVSTTFVYGWTVKPFLMESDDVDVMAELDFGYAQSKWVAERLVLAAMRQGVDATVYRPALVTASLAGRFVQRDITARVLGYMIRHGVTVDAPNQVSFLPVDICARNIVAMSRDPARPAPVLHMTAESYYTMADVCAAVTRRFGYRFAAMGLADFVAHAHAHCAPDDALYPLLSFFDRNLRRIERMGAKRYDNTEYRRARDRAALAIAHVGLEATIEPIVAYLLDHGLIPPPPRLTAGHGPEAVRAVASRSPS